MKRAALIVPVIAMFALATFASQAPAAPQGASPQAAPQVQRPPAGPGGPPPGPPGAATAAPTPARRSAQGPVPATLLTVPERTNYVETSLYDDVMAFMRAAAAKSPQIHLTTFGYSFEGRPLPLAVIGAKDGSPEAVRATGKVRIYIQANIHAGEVEGKEACLQILRDIANGRRAEWLKSTVLLIAPIFNPDGNDRVALTNRGRQNGPIGGMGQRANAQLPVNLDLNRDFMKIESPEVRSMAMLYQRYDPHLEVDLHTTDGSLHAYHLTYNSPLHPATAAGVIDVLRKELLPAVTRAVKEKDGYDFYYYANLPFRGSTERVFTADPDLYTARFEENYVGLRNRLGILSETFAYLTFKDRITVARRFVEEIVNYAARNGAQLMKATSDADKESIVGKEVAISGKVVRSAQPVPILMGEAEEERNPYTGAIMLRRKDVSKVEMMHEALTFEPAETGRAPRYYIVPATRPRPTPPATNSQPPQGGGRGAATADPWGRVFQRLTDRLLAHGVTFHKLEKPLAVKGEHFRIASTKTEERDYQGHRARTIVGAWEASDVTVPEGSVLIPVEQPLGRLVFLLLEPRSTDSLAYWNVFDEELARSADVYPVFRTLETVK